MTGHAGDSADAVVLKPNLAPEGLVDGLVTLAAGVFLLLLGGMAVVAVAAVTLVATENPVAARVAGLVTLVVLMAALFLTEVHWLRVDADGLRFGRWLGRPRLLRWADVLQVEAAPPGEVVVRGWLWPPFPPREATRSLSAHGHYRIEHTGGTCYFPPVDAAAFREAVRRFRSDLIAREAGS